MAEQLYALTGRHVRAIDELLRRGRVAGESVPGVNPLPDRQLAKVQFKCNAACPAHGVMRITAVTLSSSNWPTMTTAQPNAKYYRGQYLVNLGQDAVDGGDGFYYGCGTF